jgi:ATP-binding cassette, subfamily B, bacterial
MPENRRLLATKILGAATQLRFLPRALRLVCSAARRWSLLWGALLVVQGVLPVAIVFLTRALVDSLAGVVGSAAEWSRIVPILILAALMGGVLLLGELLRGASDWVRTVQAKLVEDYVSGLVQEKSTTVDLAFYESPDYHDHLHRARAEASSRPIALLENGGSLIQNGITLAAMAAVLIPYGLWLPAALVVSTLPALVVVLRFAVRQHRWRSRTTEDDRRTSYYDWLMTAGEAAAELRLFGLGANFRSAYQTLRSRLRKEHLQLYKAQGLADLAASAIALMISAACMAWMVWQAIQGRATLGDLALFYQAFSLGQRLVRSLLGNVGHIYYNILFLGNLFEFLDLKSQVLDPPQPRPAPAIMPESRGLGICFHDVTFCYPGSELVALQELSLAIPAGQIAAIVGTNGAGKSTLLKLLCRFYDPLAGRIELDGIDLRDLSLSELRGLITVLFQEPVHYNATVAENIAVDRPMTTVARADVEGAARAAGAEALIARLPHGYDTLLGRWFAGGVELSVGEWQRIALARAFLRRAPVIILDEPTSAMDSWAEADWLQRFRSLAAGRTAIVVTHRFTTAMQADVIHVMDNGRVIESGCHSELLRQEGAYAQSWQMQMRVEHSALD